MTYRSKYKIPFTACNDDKEAGLAQWRHYLKVDKRRPHPFHEDTQLADGTWLLGEPGWFDVVADDQLVSPYDDRGLLTHRQQAADWKYAPEVLTDKGLSEALPVKADEDTCDATRMITADWGPVEVDKSQEEKREESLPVALRQETIAEMTEEDQSRAIEKRNFVLDRLRKKDSAQAARPTKAFVNKHRFTGGRGRR
jgi:hypothetical protein